MCFCSVLSMGVGHSVPDLILPPWHLRSRSCQMLAKRLQLSEYPLRPWDIKADSPPSSLFLLLLPLFWDDPRLIWPSHPIISHPPHNPERAEGLFQENMANMKSFQLELDFRKITRWKIASSTSKRCGCTLACSLGDLWVLSECSQEYSSCSTSSVS